jgi:hypothetical protein
MGMNLAECDVRDGSPGPAGTGLASLERMTGKICSAWRPEQ